MSACSAKGEAGQLPSLCREGMGRGRRASTPQQQGNAKQRAVLLRSIGTSAQASPGAPEDGASIKDPEMRSLRRPRLIHPEEGSVLFQAWGCECEQGTRVYSSFTHSCIQESLLPVCRALETLL